MTPIWSHRAGPAALGEQGRDAVLRLSAYGAVLLLCVLLLAGCSGTVASPAVAAATSGSAAGVPGATAAIPTISARATTTQPRPTPSPTATLAPAATATAPPALPTATVPVSTSTISAPVSAGANLAYAGAACRNDLNAGVYHPQRLIVQRPCVAVTGVVDLVRQEPDGDAHVNLRLAPADDDLLNARNLAGEHGDLVVEIVPADQPSCTPGQPPKPPRGSYNYGICSGLRLVTPAVGALVQVIGPYVLDADHGWMEVHPVWLLSVRQGSAVLPPAPTSAKAAPTPLIADNQEAGVAPAGVAPAVGPAATSSPTCVTSVHAAVQFARRRSGDQTLLVTALGSTGVGVAGATGSAHIQYKTTSRDLVLPTTDGAGSTAVTWNVGAPTGAVTIQVSEHAGGCSVTGSTSFQGR